MSILDKITWNLYPLMMLNVRTNLGTNLIFCSTYMYHFQIFHQKLSQNITFVPFFAYRVSQISLGRLGAVYISWKPAILYIINFYKFLNFQSVSDTCTCTFLRRHSVRRSNHKRKHRTHQMELNNAKAAKKNNISIYWIFCYSKK